ncbi:MAG: RagB/SusD family nutrient uptake outer membrane protein [Cyclobacteriaceae bacterium]
MLILASFNSCNRVLDTEDQSAIDGESLFNDIGLTEFYLNHLYLLAIPQQFDMLENADLTNDALGGGDFIAGTVLDPVEGSDQQEGTGNYTRETYADVRNIITFIEGVETGTLDADLKDSYIGQAYFLRAYTYWDLVLYYGGVPIVDKILDINEGSANLLNRSSAAECVDFIVSDLDKSIELLTGKSLETGRITASAAAAFKGRVLLFFASPQFDPNGVNAVDGIQSRWQAAYDANLEAKAIAESEGHDLYPNYEDIFLSEDNEEVIMGVKFSTGLRTHGYDNSVRPFSVANQYQGNGQPTWNFVKAFPMADGTSIEESLSYDSTVYWVDRDPRFYSTVAYNGSNWKFTGRNGDYQWTYQNNDQESGVIPATGFYLKKNVNTSLDKASTRQTPTDWIEIRFAEVLLNLAEAANEVGETNTALDQLYAIRARAGIEQGPGNYGITASNKADLRKVIMNERRIELSFENKRHFDLRRRNLFINGVESVGNGINGSRREGIQTMLDTDYVMTLDPSATTDEEALVSFETNIRDTVNWSDPMKLDEYFNYTLEYQDGEAGGINYLQPKYNFFYLPTNATVRNENLEQTINWLDGTFDPLAQ